MRKAVLKEGKWPVMSVVRRLGLTLVGLMLVVTTMPTEARGEITVTAIASWITFNSPQAIAVDDAGNVYVFFQGFEYCDFYCQC